MTRPVHSVLEIAAKALLGGVLVVLFALLSEMVSPKRFSGIFSAAPSVALGGLSVTLIVESGHDVALAGEGMILGTLALLCYCLLAVPALRRLGALKGAGAALVVWLAIAVPGVVIWGLR
ncbi:DUF3147 family protein [Actinomadura scrupuli]|uniref:DUF3147 family protein n=1 Tax=Actinomadura scrupuli TaxID=559629 RepID=UPI003D974652